MKPYYQDDAVTIYHGDCREILPGVETEAIVTDPPYGINLDTRARYYRNADHKPITGDAEPFDPSPLLAINVPTIRPLKEMRRLRRPTPTRRGGRWRPFCSTNCARVWHGTEEPVKGTSS